MSLPRYPEYKDSGVNWLGEAPAHWKVKRLRFVATLNPSKSEIASLDRMTEVSFLPMEAIGDDSTLTLDRSRPIADVETGYTYFREGDVTVAKITPCFENGKGAVMRGLLSGVGFGTTELIVARPNATETTSDYLHWLFLSQPFRKLGEATMYGAGGQKRVPDEFVRNFTLAFPDLQEQEVIAAFLNRETAKIDTLIAEQMQLIALLKEKRQAVISHAVTKGLNPEGPMKDSGVEWIGLTSQGWVVCALTRMAERIVVGIAEAATHAYAETGTPILRSTNIRAGKIIGEILSVDPTFSGDRGSKEIRAGDLVSVRTGAAGVTAVIPPELDGCQCFTMLITTLRPEVIPTYACYWMNSYAAQTYFGLEGWGTAQINISVPILKALPLPVPPMEEQIAIVRFLDDAVSKIDGLLDEAGKAISLLSERRSALISAAVTGKIDVRHQVAAEAL